MENGQESQLAVVTGASSGIGLELAKVFASEGFDLIVAAEDDELATAATGLEGYGVDVRVNRVDLATEAGVIELHRQIQNANRPVDVLALNAGIGAGGAFATETALEDELRLIDLNVRGTVHLCKLAIAEMVERDEGRVLFTSSIAATIPGAFQAVYNASKSFVQSFALALRNELKDTGITVTALMPGATETEFFERAGMEDTDVGAGEKDDPAEVARQGFDALMADKEKVVAGAFKNKAQVAAGRVIPDSVKAEQHRKMAEPGSADDD
jgi:short-subunit dehydrogenase